MRRRILAMSLAFVMAMTPVNSYASGSPSAIPDSTTESKATIESEDIVNDDTVDMQEEPQELTYLQAEETDLGQKTRDEEGTSLECEAEAETYSKTTGIADNDELFAQYVNKVLEDDLFVDDVPATNALKAKARSVKTLSGNNKVVYDQLKEHIIKIANGQETSAIIPIYISDLIEKTSGYTAADLGVDAIVADGAMTQEAKKIGRAHV